MQRRLHTMACAIRLHTMACALRRSMHTSSLEPSCNHRASSALICGAYCIFLRSCSSVMSSGAVSSSCLAWVPSSCSECLLPAPWWLYLGVELGDLPAIAHACMEAKRHSPSGDYVDYGQLCPTPVRQHGTSNGNDQCISSMTTSNGNEMIAGTRPLRRSLSLLDEMIARKVSDLSKPKRRHGVMQHGSRRFTSSYLLLCMHRQPPFPRPTIPLPRLQPQTAGPSQGAWGRTGASPRTTYLWGANFVTD